MCPACLQYLSFCLSVQASLSPEHVPPPAVHPAQQLLARASLGTGGDHLSKMYVCGKTTISFELNTAVLRIDGGGVKVASAGYVALCISTWREVYDDRYDERQRFMAVMYTANHCEYYDVRVLVLFYVLPA